MLHILLSRMRRQRSASDDEQGQDQTAMRHRPAADTQNPSPDDKQLSCAPVDLNALYLFIYF